MLKWLRNLWCRVFSKDCVIIRNKRLRDTITMLDELVEKENVTR